MNSMQEFFGQLSEIVSEVENNKEFMNEVKTSNILNQLECYMNHLIYIQTSTNSGDDIKILLENVQTIAQELSKFHHSEFDGSLLARYKTSVDNMKHVG